MGTCVEISVDDSGAITVGLTDEPSDSSQGQPAKSIGDALAMARHLLMQPQQSSDQTSSGTPNGAGGGTGPDAAGTTVSSTADAGSSGEAGSGDAKALWDSLAQMNVPQN
jgi:hypothetical protein